MHRRALYVLVKGMQPIAMYSIDSGRYCTQCHWARISIDGCSNLQQPERAHASRTCTVLIVCVMYRMMENSSSYHACNAAPPLQDSVQGDT